MNNDFDFIKEKIENSGVKAPEEMDESYVLETLEGVQPKPAVVEKKPKRRGWKIALSATAAVLVLTIALGVVLRVHQGFLPGITGIFSTSGKTEELPGGLSLHRFSSRQEITDTVRKIRAENNKVNIWDSVTDGFRALTGSKSADALYGAAEDEEANFAADGGSSFTASASGSAGGSGSPSHSDTYKQVDGVDEADIIKTDGRYIYCVNYYDGSGQITIFSAAGENSEKIAVIDIADAYRDENEATEDEAEPEDGGDFDYDSYYMEKWRYQSVSEMYLNGDRLVVMCTDSTQDSTLTEVLVYDISDIGSITLLDRMAQSGYYSSSRMIGDVLYTVSNYYVYNDNFIPLCGTREASATPDEVPADCVYALENPDSEDFLVISAYNTVDYSVQTESKAILGSVDDIYCNLENLYIYSTYYDYERMNAFAADDVFYNFRADATSRILKVDLTDGIRFTAYAEVNGYIDDQYALDEYNGNLRVATTSTNEDGEDINNLYVLDGSLNLIGSVTGFAEDESIKAVRYLGDTAYVITYEQTDPLFVIDLSNPSAPAILGEAKITGFSTMLVPIGNDMLLGIGYHTEDVDYTDMEVTEGVKLALFDISDKTNPQVLDSISYIDCYSDVQYNPKALVYNPERNDFIIPLNYAHYSYWYDDDGYYYGGDDELYGGMLNFRIEDGKILQIDRYAADYEENVERCVYVGDTVYMTHYDYSGDGIMLDSTPYK